MGRVVTIENAVDLFYNVRKGTECFLTLQTSVAVAEECIVMVRSEELIGTAEYMTLWMKYCINRCSYNRLRLYMFQYWHSE
jgi:hypothetical protein